MEFPIDFFLDEVREGFFIPAMMKRAWAAELEILVEIDKIWENINFVILLIMEIFWVPSATKALFPGMMTLTL